MIVIIQCMTPKCNTFFQKYTIFGPIGEFQILGPFHFFTTVIIVTQFVLFFSIFLFILQLCFNNISYLQILKNIMLWENKKIRKKCYILDSWTVSDKYHENSHILTLRFLFRFLKMFFGKVTSRYPIAKKIPKNGVIFIIKNCVESNIA